METRARGKYTGSTGGLCVNLNMREDLVSVTFMRLTRLCWLNKLGDFLQDPETLVYRVFKARYFPTTDFLDARVHSNSSYVWRSIAASRPVLQKGIRWQVGNGRKVKIWKDKWVPRDFCLRILTPTPVYWDEEATVDNLFWLNSKQWNIQLLNELFSQEEVDLICDIPLSIRDEEDRSDVIKVHSN